MSQTYNYFNVTFPAPYVAHVEINRPEKLNAFYQEYPPASQYFSSGVPSPELNVI